MLGDGRVAGGPGAGGGLLLLLCRASEGRCSSLLVSVSVFRLWPGVLLRPTDRARWDARGARCRCWDRWLSLGNCLDRYLWCWESLEMPPSSLSSPDESPPRRWEGTAQRQLCAGSASPRRHLCAVTRAGARAKRAPLEPSAGTRAKHHLCAAARVTQRAGTFLTHSPMFLFHFISFALPFTHTVSSRLRLAPHL